MQINRRSDQGDSSPYEGPTHRIEGRMSLFPWIECTTHTVSKPWSAVVIHLLEYP